MMLQMILTKLLLETVRVAMSHMIMLMMMMMMMMMMMVKMMMMRRGVVTSVLHDWLGVHLSHIAAVLVSVLWCVIFRNANAGQSHGSS